jgi:predicted nucleic acid-binding protein
LTGTFLDSNVILDIATANPHWANWSEEQVAAARLEGHVWINGVVYAELCYGFALINDVDRAVDKVRATLLDAPGEALFLAAKAFRGYRERGGTKTSILPDFFIGAHAALLGAKLVTRDPKGFRAAFPTLEVVAPS